MVANLLVLILLFILAYLVKPIEKKECKNRWSKRSKLEIAIEDSIDFWRKVFANPLRFVAVMIVLICQKNVGIMLISIAALNLAPFIWAIEENHNRIANPTILKCIDWKKPNVQRIANIGCLGIAMVWLLGRFDRIYSYEIVGWLLTIIIFVFSYLLIIVRNR